MTVTSHRARSFIQSANNNNKKKKKKKKNHIERRKSRFFTVELGASARDRQNRLHISELHIYENSLICKSERQTCIYPKLAYKQINLHISDFFLMTRYRWSVLGRWRNSGETTTQDGHKLYFSGKEDRHENGVGFLVHKDTVNTVMGCQPISSRLITIRLRATPFNITLCRPLLQQQIMMMTK